MAEQVASDSKTESDPVNTAIGQAVVAALLVLSAVVATYFFVFWREGCCDQSRWGEFGDFLGGTVNPILGFLTLLVLARTLIEQRKLLQETKAQSTRQELQRVMAVIANEMDAILDAPLGTGSILLRVFKRSVTRVQLHPVRRVGDVVPGLARALLAGEVRSVYRFGLVFDPTLRGVARQIKRLEWCCAQYVARGGDEAIPVFYGDLYRSELEFFAMLHGSPESPPGLEHSVELSTLRVFGVPQSQIERLSKAIERFSAAAEAQALADNEPDEA